MANQDAFHSLTLAQVQLDSRANTSRHQASPPPARDEGEAALLREQAKMRVQRAKARVAQRLQCQESRSEAEVEHGQHRKSVVVACSKPLKRGFPCRTGKVRPNQSAAAPGRR